MKVTLRGLSVWVLTAMFMVGGGTVALAGPFILAGTDADDHGFVSAGVNRDGWFFMQRALENLAPVVTNSNQVVTILGSIGSAATAANSAFNLSSLVGAGWTVETVSVANFGTFFGVGGGLANSGILMMDSGFNATGGVDGSNFVAHAAAINAFLGNGGGLFSQSNGYEWLSTLLPTILVVSEFNTGISLTAAGTAAFPGLTNADLSAGPFHNNFQNIGAISSLAISNVSGEAVIIGSSAGSITNPGTVPEPGTALLLGAGLALFGLIKWRKALA